MKFNIISGVAAAALALSTVAAFAQTTATPGGGYNPSFKPPPDVYNNSTIGPAASDKSASSQYTLGVKPPPDVYNNSTVGPAASDKSASSQYTLGVKPPPDVYNNSTVGPAGSNKGQSGQYTQGNSQSLMPSSAAGQAEQTGPTPTKSQ